MIATDRQTFTLVFDKEYYLGGFDPSVSQSFSAQIKTKPKKEYGIKKIKEAKFLHKEIVNIEPVLCRKFYYSYLQLKQQTPTN